MGKCRWHTCLQINLRVSKIIAFGIGGNGLYQIRILVAAKALGHTLLGQNNRGYHREQDIYGAAHQILPEVADAVLLDAGQAANQAPQNGDTGGGRNKVLYGQADGLREVAQ